MFALRVLGFRGFGIEGFGVENEQGTLSPATQS